VLDRSLQYEKKSRRFKKHSNKKYKGKTMSRRMLPITKCFGLILLACAVLAAPSLAPAQISVGLSIHIGPPPLPVYVQPVCPAPGYIWTPGYWAYGPDGYFWVPGTWIVAPQVGFLWTPGYWGWGGGAYIFHAGYWGPHVGFYGGINYGFGYGGVGFVGGAWRGGAFAYNTAVTNVNTTVIHTTYIDRTVINNTTVNRVSFNGGTGGINARPSAEEQAAEHEQHIPQSSMQVQHEQAARSDRTLLASVNHGRPAVAATAKPGVFHGEGVIAAREAGSNTNHNVPRPESSNTNHPSNNNNMASNHSTQNGSVPRPPNSTANSSNNRSNNEHTNNGQASNNHTEMTANHPSTPHPSANHASAPRPSQPSHPAKNEHPSGGHTEGHKDR
jgi:WXXGXW repeat (2 copies)